MVCWDISQRTIYELSQKAPLSFIWPHWISFQVYCRPPQRNFLSRMLESIHLKNLRSSSLGFTSPLTFLPAHRNSTTSSWRGRLILHGEISTFRDGVEGVEEAGCVLGRRRGLHGRGGCVFLFVRVGGDDIFGWRGTAVGVSLDGGICTLICLRGLGSMTWRWVCALRLRLWIYWFWMIGSVPPGLKLFWGSFLVSSATACSIPNPRLSLSSILLRSLTFQSRNNLL